MTDVPLGALETPASDLPPVPGLWAILPAGGAGTRLWPLSRRDRPKFLLDLLGTGHTLLQATVDRLRPLVAERVVVVTGTAHADAVRAQLPQVERILAEPSPRDSMPAIAWAAAVVERLDPEAVIGSFAADHVIAGQDRFEECVREAAAAARSGKLVVVGIRPTGPATGFGYVRHGAPLGDPQAPTARQVVEFVEKPDARTAQGYLDTGEYVWNAGMFVVRASVLLDLYASYDPVAAAAARALAAEPDRLAQLWPQLTKQSIDHAVAEPAAAEGKVAVVPATFDWDDIGDFDSLGSLAAADPDRPALRIVGDPDLIVGQDAAGVVCAGSGRLVALIGVEDMVVVDTPDALLVMPRARAQQVKALVEELGRRGRADVT